MSHIEELMGEEGAADENKIPPLSLDQWRTISSVLATYRMMVDEHHMAEEREISKLNLSTLTKEELHIIVARYHGEPRLASVGEERALEEPGT
jgi:hypothetical protein